MERRNFLVGFAAVAGAAACSGATTGFETDGGGGGDDASGDDGGTGDDASAGDDASSTGDSATGGDSSVQSTCPATVKDTGKMASAFTVGKPVYIASIIGFVVRDAGGLYALTAVCTHSGCTCVIQGAAFYCPCHGAAFDINGAVTQGPARTALKHYAVCESATGTIAVDTKTVVAATTRYPF